MINKKIKVALCLSGEPRSSMFCFSYIYEAFLKKNPLFETDVYTHSWKGFRALELYNPLNLKIENISDIFIGDIINNLNFSSELNQQLNFYNSYTKNTNFIFNQIKMMYSIQKCFNLVQKEYDIVIRCRYDIIFSNRDFINNILYDIINKKYDIFIPYPNNLNYLKLGGYCDHLAIGNFNSMKIYSNILSHLPSILPDSKRWSTKNFLKILLDKNKIKVQQSFLNHKLVRQSNIITNEDRFNNFLDE